MSFLYQRSSFNIYCNSWPSSGLKFSHNGLTITAYRFCVTASCQWHHSRFLCASGGRHISKPLTYFYLAFLFSNSPSRQLRKCSFNTAFFSKSYLDDPFPAKQTVISPFRSDFPKNTSTPTKTVTQQPLLTDAVVTNTSSRMTMVPPIRGSEHKCDRLSRSSTANQRHATTQHFLKKTTLARTEERSRTWKNSRRGIQLSINCSNAVNITNGCTQPSKSPQTPFPLLGKHEGQKPTGSYQQTQHTKKIVFHVIGIIKTDAEFLATKRLALEVLARSDTETASCISPPKPLYPDITYVYTSET